MPVTLAIKPVYRSALYRLCGPADIYLDSLSTPTAALSRKVRGRFAIGDALAPTIAACFILVGGVLLLGVLNATTRFNPA